MRRTDRSGQIDPVAIPTPEQPFTQINLYARTDGYEQIESLRIQVFPERITDLNLEFIPISELPERWNQTVVYTTPIQNL